MKYLTKTGKVKYYASYRSAWAAANRLNKTADGGLWVFEMDLIGWYLEFLKDGE